MPLWRAKSEETQVAGAVADERVNEVENAPQNNLSLVTLLATDYLNHFIEIIMLIELLPEMPDLAEECRSWEPLTYKEHFERSQIADRQVAVDAYALVPERYRKPFEETSNRLHIEVQKRLDEILETIEDGDKSKAERLCKDAVTHLNGRLQTLNGIIHGGEFVLDQRGIDNLVQKSAAT
jgi:hypothetical protein